MTDAERRLAARWAYAEVADLLASRISGFPEEWVSAEGQLRRAELRKIRDAMARAGAVKDDLPELPTSPR